MPFEIKDDAPIPGRPFKYPFYRMDVGQHIEVPLGDDEPQAVQKRLHRSAEYAGRKIRTRTEGRVVKAWVTKVTPLSPQPRARSAA